MNYNLGINRGFYWRPHLNSAGTVDSQLWKNDGMLAL